MGDLYFGTILQWKRSNWYHHSRSYKRDNWIPAPGEPYEEAYYIAPRLWFSPTVLQPMTAPIFFRASDHIGRFDTLEVYNRCMEMQKFIACERCPNYGHVCLITNAPDPLPQANVEGRQTYLSEMTRIQRDELLRAHENEGPVPDIDDWTDKKFRTWRSRLAGYMVIPAVATSHDPVRPGASNVRYPYDHYFTHALDAREDLSKRTANGAETRAVKRTQCPGCCFGGRGYKGKPIACMDWGPRACKHGKWTEEELIETTLQGFEPHLKHHGVTLERFWQVGLLGGFQFRRDRLLWRVSRMHYDRQSPITQYDQSLPVGGIKINRVNRAERGSSEIIAFDELYKHLTDNYKERLERCKTIDRKLLAIAIHASVLRAGKGYCCKSFYWYQPNISHVRIEPNCNRVVLCVWGRSFERTHDFDSFSRLADYWGNLPYFSRFDKEPAYHSYRWR